MSDEIDQIEEGEESGKKKKGIILIVGMLLLIGVIGLGSWLAISTSDDSESPSDGENVEQVQGEVKTPEEQNKEEAVIELTTEPLYVKLEPVVTNVSEPDKYQYVQVALTVMTHNKSLESLLPKFEVKIRQIIQSSIREFPETKLLTNAGIEEATKVIKKKLNKFLAEKNIDVKYIEEVFLSDVVIE